MYLNENYIVVAAVSLFILLILFVYSQKRKNIFFVGQHYFQLMLISIAFTIISDVLMWGFNGASFNGARTFHIISSILYFSLSPLPSLFFLLYICARIRLPLRNVKILFTFSLLPVLANAILTIMSVWMGYAFRIGLDNIYHRGFMLVPIMILSYLDLIVAFIVMLVNLSKISKTEIIYIACFCFIPIVCSFLQVAYFGINTLWPGVTLTCLLVYLFSLNDSISIDQLTGIYNRRQLEQYLYVAFNKKKTSKYIVGIMVDLNDFKSINDNYGHLEGDKALEKAGGILKKAFPKAFVSRYAGDEFVIILETNSPDLEKYYHFLREAETTFNKDSALFYTLNFSIGAVIASREENQNVSSFLKEIDEKMYEDKRSRHFSDTL